MNPLDIFVIVLFSLLILVAGLSFGNQGKDMKSFFAAGGNVPWPINGLSLFMSFFSAGTFVVWGSIAYKHGMVAVSIQWMMAIGGFLIGLYIAPRWKEAKILTAGEFIKKRLGANTQRYYTYLILFLSLGYTGAFLYPVAKLVNVSSGFSINSSIVVLGLMVIIYTAVGGLWAVVITDVLQFVILTAAVVIVVPLAFEKVGGVDAFISQSPESFFDLVHSEYNGWFLFAFAIYNMIFIGGNWAYVQRYTTVNTKRDASKVAYLFGALYIISPVIWMLPPMLYRLVSTDLTGMENEGAYLLMCKTVLPNGMLGLMLGGMIFATASSVNTTLNLVAAVFTNDVYRPLKPAASEKTLMTIARTSTVVFGIITIVVALLVPYVGGIVEVVLTIGAVTGCSIYGPPIWALFSKRHNGKSIWMCTLISLVVNLFCKFLLPLIAGISLTRSTEMLLGALFPFLLLLVYEVWARAMLPIHPDYVFYREQLKLMELTQTNEPAANDNANQYGIRVLAITLLLVSLIIIGLGIIADNGTIIVTCIGGLIMVVGALMFKRRTLKDKKRPIDFNPMERDKVS